MQEYVIWVYDEKDDTKPAREYRVKAESIDEAIMTAANDSSDRENLIDAGPAAKT